MNTSRPIAPIAGDDGSPEPAPRVSRLNLNPLLQFFLTVIAGTVVAVIAWNILERFLHILILLLAALLIAYLLGPLVDRLERRGMARILAILLVYVALIAFISVGAVLVLGPLTSQLEGLVTNLPKLVETKAGAPSDIDRFFADHNINLNVADLRQRLVDYIGSTGTELLGSTLSIVAGLVTFVTDILLVLAITFYLLLDGRGMHNWALRFLPEKARARWFFVEAALNRVMGGYIRGQLIVAVTVGAAAGAGSAVLGVQYPLVIGLLAFLFEFIPMVGPVLGMVPAVIIAFFQSPQLALWVVVYFIILQQVEANVIVPRVSGHAVGLHPLAALLALLAGIELGGLGGALLAVPLAGVLYVLALAIYSDVAKQTEILVTRPRRTALGSIRSAIGRRRSTVGAMGAVGAVGAVGLAGAGPGNTGSATTLPQVVSVESSRSVAPRQDGKPGAQLEETVVVTSAPVQNERLASLAEDQAQRITQFDEAEAEAEAEAEQAQAEQEASDLLKEAKAALPDGAVT